MKKLKYLLMSFIAVFCAATLVSCSSDDEDKKAEVKEASQFQYTLTFSDDILEIADVTVYYIDTDNNEKSETVTSTTWAKTMSADKFDVSTGVLAVLKMKEGVTLTKESYDIKYSIGYNISSTKDGGVVDFKKSSTSIGMSGVSRDKVSMILENLSLETSFKVDAQGKVDFTTLSWQNNFLSISMSYIFDYSYSITFSQDLLDVAQEIHVKKIIYGDEPHDLVKGTQWKSSGNCLLSNGDEHTLKVVVSFTPREAYTFKKSSYNLTYSVEYNVTAVSRGGSLSIKETVGNSEVSKEDVNNTLKEIGRTASFKIDDMGFLTDATFE